MAFVQKEPIKKYTRDDIKKIISGHPNAMIRGLLRIYSLQTEAEKQLEETCETNGVGFTKFDGKVLATYAKRILAGNKLTGKQMFILQCKIPKYYGQLARYANGEIVNHM